jgi:hypothetical protein
VSAGAPPPEGGLPPGPFPAAAATGDSLLAAEVKRELALSKRVDEAPGRARSEGGGGGGSSPGGGGGGSGAAGGGGGGDVGGSGRRGGWGKLSVQIFFFILVPWGAALALGGYWQMQRNAERFELSIEAVGPPPESKPGSWLWVKHGVGMFSVASYVGRPEYDPLPVPAALPLARPRMQYETDLRAELLTLWRDLAEKMLAAPAGTGTESARVYVARARLFAPLPRDTELALQRMEAEIALRDARRYVDSVWPTLAAARKSLALVRDAGRYADVAAIETMIEEIERAHVDPLDATTGAMPPPRPGGAGNGTASPAVPDGTGHPDVTLPEAVADASAGWWDAGVAPSAAPSSAPAMAPSIPPSGPPSGPPGPGPGASPALRAETCPPCLACAPCVCRCEGGVPSSAPARPSSAQPKTAAPSAAPKGRLL